MNSWVRQKRALCGPDPVGNSALDSVEGDGLLVAPTTSSRPKLVSPQTRLGWRSEVHQVFLYSGSATDWRTGQSCARPRWRTLSPRFRVGRADPRLFFFLF